VKELPQKPPQVRETPIKTRRSPGRARPSRVDAAPPRFLVWIRSEDLDEGSRRTAAKAGGLAPAVVQDLIERDLPVPVYGAATEREAQLWMKQVDLPLRVAETDTGLPMLSISAAALLAVLAVVAAALLPPLGLILALATVFLGYFRVARPILETRQRLAAWEVRASGLPTSAERSGALLGSLRELRSELLRASLAEVVRLDLDGQLQDLIWELEELEPAEDRLRRALASDETDPELKRRLTEVEARCSAAEERLRQIRSAMAVQA
jgi:hypothetical protein